MINNLVILLLIAHYVFVYINLFIPQVKVSKIEGNRDLGKEQSDNHK